MAEHRGAATPRAAEQAPMIPDVFGLYLDDLGRQGLLDARREADLAKRIAAGRYAQQRLARAGEHVDRAARVRLERIVRDGRQAQERLVVANLRLVVAVAKQYRTTGVAMSDLVQDGNLGLLEAVVRFDAARGSRFSTYASWWIRKTIGQGLTRRSRTIRLPAHLVDLLGRAQRAEHELVQALGREPEPEEVAAHLGVAGDRLAEARRRAGPPSSLDAPTGDAQGDAPVGELLADRRGQPPVEAASASLLATELRFALGELDDQQREVLAARYGLRGGSPETLEVIAARLGVPRESVRQIERRALASLRSSPRAGRGRLAGYLA